MKLIISAIVLSVLIGAFICWRWEDKANTDREVSPDTSNRPIVVIETNKGNITLELFADLATTTVKNFLSLAEKNFYNGTKFHRVIKNFMIQGGDPLSKGDDTRFYGTGGPGYQFRDEINDESFVRGVLAMANSGPNTNDSQFFIVTAKETPWLVGRHTIFGKVTAGMDVVDKIESMRTGANDFPVEPVIVERVIIK
jgi:cyclophilin family peptidyl-prolyl cis-trans isomerase